MRLIDSVDDEAEEAITGLAALSRAFKELAVIARARGAARYKFICPLRPKLLTASLDDLDGECVVVGTLQRKLKSTEQYSLFDSLGVGNSMPRAQRREADRAMRKSMPDAIVSAPAAILSPIAIYR